ncbi:tail fiber domain-containing protein [Prescottella subtropica]|uniref:tail fiber domain-containing protein n=1 Tax=Prescottella subtropica TaxID=2545757 RepID=UPI0010F73B8E|nr:tail fiber domain-containing protein [Prescottella subtropica]
MSVDSPVEQWVDTTQGRVRAQVRARTRHPVAWLRSAVTHRRGVGTRPASAGADEVLDRLTDLPVSVWTYGFDHPSVRHLGPMSQDFATAFGLGASTHRIDPVDAIGVCMASIQALQRRVAALEAELERRE